MWVLTFAWVIDCFCLFLFFLLLLRRDQYTVLNRNFHGWKHVWKSLLSHVLASKGPGPGTCSLNLQQQGWAKETGLLSGNWRALLCIMFGEERWKLFWKNSHWLQTRGRWREGSSRIETRSVRRKYFYFWPIVGDSPQSSCIRRMRWPLVVTTEVASKLQCDIQECEHSSWLIAIKWLITLISLLHHL